MRQKTRFEIRPAGPPDTSLVLTFIRELAEYEKLTDEVIATEEGLRRALFDDPPAAHALLGYEGDIPVCFAVYFYHFSTFAGQKGLYLEDLFVRPEYRGRGFGKAMLRYLAGIAGKERCARFEWAVLDWNRPAIRFYRKLGAVAMDDWTVYRLSGKALNRLAGPEPL